MFIPRCPGLLPIGGQRSLQFRRRIPAPQENAALSSGLTLARRLLFLFASQLDVTGNDIWS
jgi:hypothetical protein